MLAADGGLGVVLLAVVVDFVEGGRVDLKTAVLGQQLETRAVVEVVVKLAVASQGREGKAIDDFPFPQAPQMALRYVLVASDQADQLRRRREAVTQNRRDDVQVAVTDAALVFFRRPLEFGKAFGGGHRAGENWLRKKSGSYSGGC